MCVCPRCHVSRLTSATQKGNADKPVDFSPQYWRRWQGQKKADLAASHVKQVGSLCHPRDGVARRTALVGRRGHDHTYGSTEA